MNSETWQCGMKLGGKRLSKGGRGSGRGKEREWCLSAGSILEEDSSIDGAVLGADALLATAAWLARLSRASWVSIVSWLSWGSWWSLWSRASWLSWASRLSWASWLAWCSGISWWSWGSLASLLGLGWWSWLSWASWLSGASGVSCWSWWSWWAGSWVAAALAGLSWASGLACWSWWAWLAWLTARARPAWGGGDRGAHVLGRLAGASWLSWASGVAGVSWWAGGSSWAGASTAAASRAAASTSSSASNVAAAVNSGVAGAVAGLTSGTVASCNRDGLQVVDLRPDVLGGALALAELSVHGVAHVLHILVEHGQGEAHGDERDDREGDGRVGHEAVGLDPVLVVCHRIMCVPEGADENPILRCC